MSNLLNEVSRHLTDDVIIQISRQLGATDPNQVKRATQYGVEVLLDAITRNANSQNGGGLFGALKKDHDGGILGDLMGVLSGKKQVNNPSTMNGEGIVGHLLGNKQIEVAQVISQHSGLHFFKTGVLLQILAPIIMGVVGQTQRSSGLDLGGLAQVLMGGKGRQATGQAGGLLSKVLDMDGDGNMMDDLLNIGMKILKR
jgi:hypothetical protein